MGCAAGTNATGVDPTLPLSDEGSVCDGDAFSDTEAAVINEGAHSEFADVCPAACKSPGGYSDPASTVPFAEFDTSVHDYHGAMSLVATPNGAAVTSTNSAVGDSSGMSIGSAMDAEGFNRKLFLRAHEKKQLKPIEVTSEERERKQEVEALAGELDAIRQRLDSLNEDVLDSSRILHEAYVCGMHAWRLGSEINKLIAYLQAIVVDHDALVSNPEAEEVIFEHGCAAFKFEKEYKEQRKDLTVVGQNDAAACSLDEKVRCLRWRLVTDMKICVGLIAEKTQDHQNA